MNEWVNKRMKSLYLILFLRNLVYHRMPMFYWAFFFFFSLKLGTMPLNKTRPNTESRDLEISFT